MNRKTFRYLIPMVLAFGLLFAAVASAAPTNAPTVSNTVCVGVEGTADRDTYHNPPGQLNIETVSWELRTAGSSTVVFDPSDGGSQQGVYDETEKHICFEIIGVSGQAYDLYVKGEDTLGVLISNFNYQPAGQTTDLSATITLPEGDAENDVENGETDVDFSDFTALSTVYNQTGPNLAGDFDEDEDVDFSDFTLLSTNYNSTGDAREANAETVNVPTGAATLRLEAATDSTTNPDGQPQRYRLYIDNPGSEPIRSAQFLIDYNEDYLTFQAYINGSACFGFDPFAGCDFDLAVPPNNNGDTVLIGGSKGGGAPLTQASIYAGIVQFGIVQECNQGDPCSVVGVQVIGDDADDNSSTHYQTDDSRAIESFANCNVTGTPCQTDFLAVSVSSLNANASLGTLVVSLFATLGLLTVAAVRRKNFNA